MAIFLMLKKILDTGMVSEMPVLADLPACHDEQSLQLRICEIFGRAVAIRHVDTGSCNACELEINALGGPHYNIEGVGVTFVASPRHADVLLVTGPVTRHMESALMAAWEAMPAPKWVVAMGDCTGHDSLFGENYAVRGKLAEMLPVSVVVTGCPPSPANILRGILACFQSTMTIKHID